MKTLNFIFSFALIVIVASLFFLQLDIECFFALYFLGALCLVCLLYIQKENKL